MDVRVALKRRTCRRNPEADERPVAALKTAMVAKVPSSAAALCDTVTRSGAVSPRRRSHGSGALTVTCQQSTTFTSRARYRQRCRPMHGLSSRAVIVLRAPVDIASSRPHHAAARDRNRIAFGRPLCRNLARGPSSICHAVRVPRPPTIMSVVPRISTARPMTAPVPARASRTPLPRRAQPPPSDAIGESACSAAVSLSELHSGHGSIVFPAPATLRCQARLSCSGLPGAFATSPD